MTLWWGSGSTFRLDNIPSQKHYNSRAHLERGVSLLLLPNTQTSTMTSTISRVASTTPHTTPSVTSSLGGASVVGGSLTSSKVTPKSNVLNSRVSASAAGRVSCRSGLNRMYPTSGGLVLVVSSPLLIRGPSEPYQPYIITVSLRCVCVCV